MAVTGNEQIMKLSEFKQVDFVTPIHNMSTRDNYDYQKFRWKIQILVTFFMTKKTKPLRYLPNDAIKRTMLQED